MFGYLENGVIKNFSVSGYISLTNQNKFAGSVTAYNVSGTVSNCSSSCTVIYNGALTYAGGVVGYNAGLVTDCFNTGAVAAQYAAGGIVAFAAGGGTIRNCYNTGAVKCTGMGLYDSRSGGIVGYNYNSSIINCYNTASITATADSSYHASAGGIAGYSYAGGVITGCYSSGAISGTAGTTHLGGVVGWNRNDGGATTTSDCYWLASSCSAGTGTSSVSFSRLSSFNAAGILAPTSIYGTDLLSALNGWVDARGDESLKHWGVSAGENDGYPILVTLAKEPGFAGDEVYYYHGGYYPSADDALAGTNSVGDYPIMQDFLDDIDKGVIIHMMSAYTVSDAQAINGGTVYDVTLLRHDSYLDGNLITVAAGGDLTLSHITVDGGAVWSGELNSTTPAGRTNTGLVASAPLITVDGSMALCSGTALQNNDRSSSGGGVYVAGTLTMTGGEISNNRAYGDTAGVNGGGVYVATSGTFSMNDGSISDNHAANYGGGIHITGHGAFTMTGGDISGNMAVSGLSNTGCGGGVALAGGTFTLTDGNISNNYATLYGGGVRADGFFYMEGGLIFQNRSENGGGVYLNGHNSSTAQGNVMVLSGGKISDNTATDGGGVYVGQGSQAETNHLDGPTLTMTGGVISDNTATSVGGAGIHFRNKVHFVMSGGSVTDNTGLSQTYLYLAAGGTVCITGGTTAIASHAGNEVVPTNGSVPVYSNTITLAAGNAETSALCANAAVAGITSNLDYSYGVNDVFSDNACKLYLWLPVDAETTGVTTTQDAFFGSITSAVAGTSATFYTTIGDAIFVNGSRTTEAEEDGSTPETSYKSISAAISAANARLIRSTNTPYTGALLTVNKGGKLTLSDVSVDGGPIWAGAIDTDIERGTMNRGKSAFASLVIVEDGGMLTTNSGAVLQNNVNDRNDNISSSGCGGGVRNGGTFTMTGGSIFGNTAGMYGGSVHNTGTFNMVGGTISGNTAGHLGAGVNSTGTRGTFTMSGGTITNNKTVNHGGGVYNTSVFTMEGGTIADNKANYYGGFYNSGGTFTMTGGTISGNEATVNGGGGGAGSGTGGTFTMTGGTISGNEATANGGGVYVGNSRITISGGTISNNTSDTGGGIYNDGTLTIDGGILSGNRASTTDTPSATGTVAGCGGGVYNNGTLVVKGGTVADNTADVPGTNGICSAATAGIPLFSGGSTQSFYGIVPAGRYLCTITLADAASPAAAPVAANKAVSTILSGALTINGSIDTESAQNTITVGRGFVPTSPIILTSDAWETNRVVATYGEGLTPNPSHFTVEGYTLKISGQNLVIGGAAVMSATLTATGEGVSLGAGQSRSHTFDLSGLFTMGHPVYITNVQIASAVDGFSLRSFGEVWENRRNYGSADSNTIFGVSAKLTGGSIMDVYADSYTNLSIPLGTMAEDSTVTLMVYNGNAITQGGTAGTLIITFTDGTASYDVEVTINRRHGGQISVTVPLQVTGVMDASGTFAFPGTADYSIKNFSDIPITITQVEWVWRKEDGVYDTDDMFYDYTLLTGMVSFGGENYKFTGTAPAAALPVSGNTIIAYNGIIPGELKLGWGMTLGEGNYMKSTESANVASITYTIGAAQ